MAENLFDDLLKLLASGSQKALARCISLVENQVTGYGAFMRSLPASDVPVIGITGPPGAGKSTLVDAIVGELVNKGKSVGILCIDPSSPFNYGALLGDRIRMSRWYNHPSVFIRSVASRGALGGLHPQIIEITDVMRAAQFDCIIVETVGVGQSEVEIAGLADITLLVLVPEAGDGIQAMKAGIMEIADLFVVNKADRPGASDLVQNLKLLQHGKTVKVPVLQTVAAEYKGIDLLVAAVFAHLSAATSNEKKAWLYTEKAWQLLQKQRMAGVNKWLLHEEITRKLAAGDFNLYDLALASRHFTSLPGPRNAG